MQIDNESGSAFLEWLSEEIDSANDDRHGLGYSLAATSLGDWLGGIHICTRYVRFSRERITLSHAWVEGRRKASAPFQCSRTLYGKGHRG